VGHFGCCSKSERCRLMGITLALLYKDKHLQDGSGPIKDAEASVSQFESRSEVIRPMVG
jgi:hypothetical protein